MTQPAYSINRECFCILVISMQISGTIRLTSMQLGGHLKQERLHFGFMVFDILFE